MQNSGARAVTRFLKFQKSEYEQECEQECVLTTTLMLRIQFFEANMKKRNPLAVVASAFLLYGVAPNSTPAQTPDSWQVPIRVQIETFEYDLYFGVRPDATEGFNAGIDTVAPPPAFTPYAVFSIPTLPGTLRADFRGPDDVIAWHLRLLNAAHLPVKISWDAQQLPSPAALTLNDSLDMLAQDSAVVLNMNAAIIKYTALPTRVASPQSPAPATLALKGFPNPFSSATAFEIQSPASPAATLRICNVLGQEIRAFALPAGQQNLQVLHWDGKDARGLPAPNGIYFCRLEAAGTATVKKIVKISKD